MSSVNQQLLWTVHSAPTKDLRDPMPSSWTILSCFFYQGFESLKPAKNIEEKKALKQKKLHIQEKHKPL